MIDLTRLMFDDGAERAPLQAATVLRDVFIEFRGKKYRGYYRPVQAGDVLPAAVAFYGPDHAQAGFDMWGINVMLSDPQKYMTQWAGHRETPNWSSPDTVLDWHIRDGIIWYVFEEIP